MSELIDRTDPTTTRRKRVAFLTDADDTGSVEGSTTWHAVEEAGAEPVCLPSQRAGEFFVDEYDALVLSDEGTEADDATVELVREFSASGKPVAALEWPAWLGDAVPPGNLITGDDSPAFSNALLEALAHGDAGTA